MYNLFEVLDHNNRCYFDNYYKRFDNYHNIVDIDGHLGDLLPHNVENYLDNLAFEAFEAVVVALVVAVASVVVEVPAVGVVIAPGPVGDP